MTDTSTRPLGGARAAILLAACIAAGCRNSDVVAEVGSRKIHREELLQFSRARGMPPEASLPALVDRSLLAEGARKKGLDDDRDVRARVAGAEREALAQAMLEKATSAQMTDEALRKRYEAQKGRLARKRIHVAHAFIQAPAGGDDRMAREKAERVYAKAVSGGAFSELAKTASEDSATAARGGDLGPIEEGQVDPAFFEAAARLKAGEISRPVRTAFGFHVIKALDGPSTAVPPFEAVRGQLTAEAAREAADELVAQLRSRVSIKTHPERIAVGGDR
jgi:parvulin-like peptidyl-prolyl isomerase